jgi:uncharacterized protein
MKPRNTSRAPAFTVQSPQTGTDYPVYTDLPAGAAARAALILMDGDFLFDPAVAVARELEQQGVISPVAVIGVGYGAFFGQPGNHRGRDYTPTASADEPSSGGADAFLAFLTDTLWPEVERRCALAGARRVLAGHSLGSLLVLHAVFQPRPFFDTALASAPSIWWDNRSILGLAARLREAQDRLPARLFLCVGEDDTPSMTGDLRLLEEQLTQRPFAGLDVRSARFPGKDHYNVVPDALRAGLASLLGSGDK